MSHEVAVISPISSHHKSIAELFVDNLSSTLKLPFKVTHYSVTDGGYSQYESVSLQFSDTHTIEIRVVRQK